MTIVHVEGHHPGPAKTSVPSSIGPTAPPSDTPNDTNMADDTRRSVRSMVRPLLDICLQVSSPVTSTPRVLDIISYSSKRYTWDQGSSSPAFQPAKTPAERTIEPTSGAPGRGVVHPMNQSSVSHRCFRGSEVPRALSPTSTWKPFTVTRPAKTSVPTLIGSTTPPHSS